jgi:hypothetical protein
VDEIDELKKSVEAGLDSLQKDRSATLVKLIMAMAMAPTLDEASGGFDSPPKTDSQMSSSGSQHIAFVNLATANLKPQHRLSAAIQFFSAVTLSCLMLAPSYVADEALLFGWNKVKMKEYLAKAHNKSESEEDRLGFEEGMRLLEHYKFIAGLREETGQRDIEDMWQDVFNLVVRGEHELARDYVIKNEWVKLS